jgi:hypothetical protein
MTTSDKKSVIDGCTCKLALDPGYGEQTITSDEEVIDGCTYRIVLASGTNEETLTIKSETFALLLAAWRRMENEHGRRIHFVTFFEELLRRYTRARSVNPTNHPFS